MKKKKTIWNIIEKKQRHEKITVLTAYDFPTARLVDASGMDIILVGDSLGMVVQGGNETLAVTLDEMVYHSRLVSQAVHTALVVGDMPFGSFHESPVQTAHNAIRFVKEGGVDAVKIEGGKHRLDMIRAILNAEIPVMGHIGLTPQSVHRFGGYKVQGRALADIDALIYDALALQEAGCFAIVLEGIPYPVAEVITRKLAIPTIGIGAGPACDGQVLVFHDMMGLTPGNAYKFVRAYANLTEHINGALERYIADIRSGAFPSIEESYSLDPAIKEQLEKKYGNHL